MLAKTVTAAGAIASLYLAYHHAWSGLIIAGLIDILAARWSELSRMLHIWRGKRADDMRTGTQLDQRLRATRLEKDTSHRVKS